MATDTLPVRFPNARERCATLSLATETTALMVVHGDGACGPAPTAVIARRIAPALAAARRVGIKVIDFHNAPGGEGGPGNIMRGLHGRRHGRERLGPPGWNPYRPGDAAWIALLDAEPAFQKAERNGVRDTFADRWLKTWGIDTLVAVGFSLRSCLSHTCIGALEHNDRVVLPRDGTDPPGAEEFPDTVDPANPEGGWPRFVVPRIVETNEGYTSTAGEFVRACEALHGHAVVGGTRGRQMGAPVALSRPADPPSPGSRQGASP